jgi:hypothetical protein
MVPPHAPPNVALQATRSAGRAATLPDPQASDTREDTPSSVHWLWTLDFHNGRVTFRSTGFTQSFRRPPVFNSSQSLTLEERGGLSFERGRTGERAT